MIHASCSCSFSPGKIGYPVYISARIHPKLHICQRKTSASSRYKRQATHVDSHVIVHAENDLWTAVESRLDVGVD